MNRLAAALATCLVIACLPSVVHGMDRTVLRWIRSKPPIDSIVISGNSFFKASDIRKRMYSHERTSWRTIKGDRRARIQRESYGRDTLEIKYLYLTNGFLGIQVKEHFEILGEDSCALIRVTVEEGRQFFYGQRKITSSFENRLAFDLGKIAARRKEGEPINLFDLHDAVFDMKTVLANEGYPYATVTFNLDTNQAVRETDVTFKVVTDSLVRFGDVRIDGIRRYPERVAQRELRIKPGAIYRRNDIINSHQRLVESGYFSTLQLRRADTLSNRLRPDFLLRVREKKPTYLTVKTGVGQSEVRDLTWDFSTGFGKRNFLGSRHYSLFAQLQFGLGHDTRLLNHNYRLRFTEPWFLGIRMPLSLTAKYEPGVKHPVQNYRIETWSATMSTNKNIGREIKTDLGFEYEKVNIYGIPEDQVDLSEDLKKKNSYRRKLYTTFRRDSRDDIFIPCKGSVIDLSVEYFGGFLGGDDSFYRWQATWSSYQVVWPGWISATRIRVGHAKAFGESEDVPVDDRFYLGGANTVRGFKENTLGPTRDDGTPRGANITFVFNQEFRWRTLQIFRPIPVLSGLFRSLPLWQSVFLDVGNGFTHTSEFKFNSLAYCYGTGVQIVSPAGPIRVDYARRIKTDKIDFADRWHFTILYAF